MLKFIQQADLDIKVAQQKALEAVQNAKGPEVNIDDIAEAVAKKQQETMVAAHEHKDSIKEEDLNQRDNVTVASNEVMAEVQNDCVNFKDQTPEKKIQTITVEKCLSCESGVPAL